VYLIFHKLVSDGSVIRPGDIVFTVEGNSISILSGERLALNFMQRMSGIATYTNKLVSLIAGTKTKLLDTRKTTPCNRIVEKMAVKAGGGENHRFGLYDMIMIKDNHLVLTSIEVALKKVRDFHTDKKVEIEVESSEDALKAAKNAVDIIMLDNMSPEEVEKTVDILKDNNLRDSVLIEVSGGINLENIEKYTRCDVDIISIGAITNDAKSIDFSLEIFDE